MKPSFSIGAKNGLLEQKHLDALGSAIWLYLWFLDKQPKNTDKVLGGKPVTYQMFAQQFPGLPRRTYVRWLSLVHQGGYIDLLRTPKGYVITINKAKKWVRSDVPKSVHHSHSDVPNLVSDVPKVAHAEDVPKSVHPIKRNSLKKQKETINTLATKSPEHEQVSKLFYEVIKSNGIPLGNNNNNRKWIKDLITEVEYDKLITYLIFMRDKFPTLSIPFKPHLNTAYDIYSKRKQVENAMIASLEVERKVFRI